MMAATTVLAGQQLSLKDISGSAFRAQTMVGVESLNDGESYTQISSDGKQIVKYSFKTGKQSGVLFDVKTVRGPKIERVDGYIMSPDGVICSSRLRQRVFIVIHSRRSIISSPLLTTRWNR
jgi:dipeptidyl-peptidase-4